MLLKQLLKNLDYTLVQGCLNTEVTDIYYDSRKVTPGGLFVCIVGTLSLIHISEPTRH